jgi:plastocyanin
MMGITSLLPGPANLAAQQRTVSGTVIVWQKGDRQARDVGSAVVWLDGEGMNAPSPDSVMVLTEGKEFRPRVSVITVGSTVVFPNGDPFNHNVFSLSPEGAFDLGLYGRGTLRSTSFRRPGLIRVYCNVHASMSAFVLVLATPFHSRPAADGTFRLAAVPPGRYVLKAWHERADAVAERAIVVPADGLAGLRIEVDAREFKEVTHLNKFGQPYRAVGRRY